MENYRNNRKEWEDELIEAPGLRQLNGKEPFAIPEGYFEKLEAAVHVKISNSNKPDSVFDLSMLFKRSLAIAAIIVAVVLIFKLKQDDNNMQVAVNYDNIYNSDLASELDEELLIATLASDTLISNDYVDLDNYIVDEATEEYLINEL